MRSSKVIGKKLQEAEAKSESLTDKDAPPRKKMDWMYTAGYRDALRWVLNHGRS